MRAKRWVALAAVATVAVAAGCGGDDGDGLSKAAFLQQGNAICTEGSNQLQAAFVAFANEKGLRPGQSPSRDQAAEFLATVALPGLQSQVDALRGLEPPAADEEEVDRLLTTTQELLDEAEADPRAFARRDDSFAPANRLAIRYGLNACGSGR
jgi:hypothetical protein